MKATFYKILAPLAVFWAFGTFCGLSGVPARGVAASGLPAQAPTHFAIADFDGDSRPDLASVHVGQSSSHSTRYWIAFQLSRGTGQTVGITAPTGGLQISSRDVNGDSFPDVVITTAWTNTPVAILLNDGFGNFTVSSPSEFQSAFTASQKSWTLAANEIRDAVAALVLSRGDSGDCLRESGSLLPSGTTPLLALQSGLAPVLAFVSPFIGRAPPFVQRF